MASAMTKRRKPKWKQRKCGCIKTTLPQAGRVLIRCRKHRGKPTDSGRLLCHFDDAGLIRPEVESSP